MVSANKGKITAKIHVYALKQFRSPEFYIRIATITISYVSVIPFIAPAKQAFSDPILKNMFASGEILAWGSFFAWSAMNIIDCIKEDRKIDREFMLANKRKCHITYTIYWGALISLGLIAQAPSAYLSYRYNDGDIFWSIFAPLVYSSFAIFSLDSFIQKIINTDCWINRKLSCQKDKFPILRAGENFAFLLGESLSALLNSSPQAKERIIDILLHPNKYNFRSKRFFPSIA